MGGEIVKDFRDVYYGVHIQWPKAAGSGIAISFAMRGVTEVFLVRAGVQGWILQAGAFLFTRTLMQIRNNTITRPVGEILDITAFAGVTIVSNLGNIYANDGAPWYGCQPLSPGKLYDIVVEDMQASGGGNPVNAFINLAFKVR